MYFFTAGEAPVPFYLFSCLAQFFFSGFNTAIYAIVPDCVEYGEWKTGLRNDGFQYAFISLGNKYEFENAGSPFCLFGYRKYFLGKQKIFSLS